MLELYPNRVNPWVGALEFGTSSQVRYGIPDLSQCRGRKSVSEKKSDVDHTNSQRHDRPDRVPRREGPHLRVPGSRSVTPIGRGAANDGLAALISSRSRCGCAGQSA